MEPPARFLFIVAILAGVAAGASGQELLTSAPSKSFFALLESGAANSLAPGKTKTIGGPGGDEFADVHPGGILVGLEIWKGGSDQPIPNVRTIASASPGMVDTATPARGDFVAPMEVIRGIRPIFETAAGRVPGKLHGMQDGPSIMLEAKEGFAIAGIEVKGARVLYGLQVVFWQIHETGPNLDPVGSYKSELVGDYKGSKGVHLLTADGKIITGIFGGSAYALDRIGLVYIDRK